MNSKLTLEQLKWRIRSKWNAFKGKAKKWLSDAWMWTCSNLEQVVVLVPLLIALLKAIGGMVITKKRGKMAAEAAIEEDLHRRRDVYDRRNGYTIRCNRDLTNSDRVEIDIRRRQGESVTQILRDMRLL